MKNWKMVLVIKLLPHFFLIITPSFAQVEAKTDSIPIGILEDDFVDVMDLDEPLPGWALTQ